MFSVQGVVDLSQCKPAQMLFGPADFCVITYYVINTLSLTMSSSSSSNCVRVTFLIAISWRTKYDSIYLYIHLLIYTLFAYF